MLGEKMNRRDIVDMLMAYEEGSLSQNDEIKLFQHLVDTGLAWSLQGHYGRVATSMLNAGLINNKARNNKVHGGK